MQAVPMSRLVPLLGLLALALSVDSAILSDAKERSMHPGGLKSTVGRAAGPTEEQVAKFWKSKGMQQVKAQLAREKITTTAKNIILFLGDGMSFPTTAAARMYMGNENVELTFDTFPQVGMSKTYCVDSQVADSACSSTAYLCGVKANIGTMGITASVSRGDCVGQVNSTNHVDSILAWAQAAGKSTGVVTTTRVTHASPGGTYAHIADRNWESDQDVTSAGYNSTWCKDIAQQLVQDSPGKNITVILGGGRREFVNTTVVAGTADEDGEISYGKRQDGQNLIETWQSSKGSSGKYVADRDSLLAVDVTETDYLLGLFGASHVAYNLDRNKTKTPSLAEMTVTAINILSKNSNGYYLFVEGGRIDMGHHDALAHYALEETKEFSKAIEAAVNMTSEDDTLIVVTADHAHTMSYAGYAQRGNDIFGYPDTSDVDNMVYTTLAYANGPGYKTPVNNTRPDPEKENPSPNATDYLFPAAAPLSSETHGGDDVGIFARGPWSHLYGGVLEQNTIPYIMAYSAAIGPYADSSSSASQGALSELLMFVMAAVLISSIRV